MKLFKKTVKERIKYELEHDLILTVDATVVDFDIWYETFSLIHSTTGGLVRNDIANTIHDSMRLIHTGNSKRKWIGGKRQ